MFYLLLLCCGIVFFILSFFNPPNGEPIKIDFTPLVQQVEFKESRGENVCRAWLEKHYGCKFPRVRPDFLQNSTTGRNLELDCYNEEIKIACEYNGLQHYKFTPKYHKNYKDFQKQKDRDTLKRILCKRKGVTLITVPYWIKEHEIPSYLAKEVGESKAYSHT